MKLIRQIQQGDVCLEKVEIIPNQAKIKPAAERGYILALGEHTGHMHCIEQISKAQFYELDGVLFVKALEPVELSHEEHNTVTIPMGNWEVGIVREYDYFLEMSRQVKD